MAGRSPASLPAKVQRRVRRLSREGARSVRRTTGALRPLTISISADQDDLSAVAAALTPAATRRALRITATGPVSLRALAITVDPACTILDLDVVMTLPPRWSAPPGHPRLALPGITHLSVDRSPRTVKVAVRLNHELPLAQALWAVSAVLTPSLNAHAEGSADVHFTDPGHPDVAAFGVGARVQFGDYPDTEARDVESANAIDVPLRDPARPAIDLSVAHPIGWSLAKTAAPTAGSLRIDGGSLELSADAGPLVTLPARQLLDESAVARSRGITGATARVAGDSRSAAQRLAEMAATGLVIHAPDLPASVIDHLEPALALELAQALPSVSHSADDRLSWRIRSVAMRRAAMTGHGAPFVLAESGGRDARPEVSVLLVTNRVAMVAPSLRALARQQYPRLEIVLGLHGHTVDDLPADAVQALDDLAVPVTTLALDGGLNLGQALAQCTTVAQGTLLVKWDDDDHYGPAHIGDLVLARIFTGADLIGKAPEFTELQASQRLLQRSFPSEEAWGDYIIGATMLMARGPLLAVGGWRPTPWAVDKALLDRFTSSGGTVYRTHNLGWAYVRRGEGHTWARDDDHFVSQAKHIWEGDAAATMRDLVVGT